MSELDRLRKMSDQELREYRQSCLTAPDDAGDTGETLMFIDLVLSERQSNQEGEQE